MKLAIFIAGEKRSPSQTEEFFRYKDWIEEKYAEQYKCRSANTGHGSRDDDCLPFIFVKMEDEYAVVVIRKNTFLKSFSHRTQFEKVEVEQILKCVLCADIMTLVGDPLEVYIFAHWHSHQPLEAESSFNDSLKKIQIGNICDKKIADIQSFAVSSRRKYLFNLETINIPKTIKDLDTLISSFKKGAGGCGELTAPGNIAIKANGDKDITILLIGEERSYFKKVREVLTSSGLCKIIFVSDIKSSEQVEGCFPLFCGTYARLKELGFSPPEEFILLEPEESILLEEESSGKHSENWVDEYWNSLLQDIDRRLQIWEKETDFKLGIPLWKQKEWCAGAFRCFCMLDRDVHGSSAGTIDLQKAKERPEDFWRDHGAALRNRVKGEDSVFSWQIPLWNVLFPANVNSLKNVIEDGGKDFYERFMDGVKVAPNGSEVAFSAPTRKVNILLLDDDVNENMNPIEAICEKLDKEEKEKYEAFLDVFTVTTSKINIDDSSLDFRTAVQVIKSKSKGRSFDAILLDLHLGNGDDPAGYQLIGILRILFPTIPVIVYSRYDDMGHIERAFRAGAHWYIKKNDVYKLPRHFISLLTSRQWQKEWRTITALNICNEFPSKNGVQSDFVPEQDEANFLEKLQKDEWQYLTYKALEKNPGQRMLLRPMGGGFSSAGTFRVIKVDRSFNIGTKETVSLPSPVIVKIDKAFNTMTEYERYFRFIRPYIANESGRVENNAVMIDTNYSIIVYTYAGKCCASNELLTFREMFSKDIMNLASCRFEGYARILDDLFKNILPRIHKVPDAKDSASEYSSYPNHFLGEVDAEGAGFVGNYRVRMPLARHYNVAEFCRDATVKDGVIQFEFKDTFEYKDEDNGITKHAIEALEWLDAGEGEYSKMTVILEGPIVEHVVRFRSKLLIPGKMLYVKVAKSNVEIKQEDLSGCLNEVLAKNKNLCYAEVFPDSHTTHRDGKEYFCELYRKFSGSSSVGFDTIVEELYKKAMEIIKKYPDRFSCRTGIVHGDLNFANIMLDRQSGVAGGFDVWLIDFARTRRDVIAHDFNVFFTATLAQLFKNEIWYDERQIDPYSFAKKLLSVFHKFAVDVIFSDVAAVGGLSDVPPDYIANDRRLKMVYQILRRVRRAAIEAKVSKDEGGTEDEEMARHEDVYAMTTALCCLYTFRIFLKHEHNVQGAAALLAVAHLCLKKLDDDNACNKKELSRK